MTAWSWAACHGGHVATAELLLDAGADRNGVSDWDGLTPLATALRAAGERVTGAEEVGACCAGRGARSVAAGQN